jgi:hypothetical protein
MASQLRETSAAANGRFAAATAGRRWLGLGCRDAVGGSSCPQLLRHQEAEVPVGKVARLPAGTVYQFRHLEPQRRRATRPC